MQKLSLGNQSEDVNQLAVVKQLASNAQMPQLVASKPMLLLCCLGALAKELPKDSKVSFLL